jgi:hypothetical protein
MDRGNIYYVYVLFRPWNGTPFYVGKGKDRRWLEHERLVERHCNKHAASIIKIARSTGLEIPRVKVRDGLTEAQAFETEIALIAAIGRGKNGPLANLTDGGEGCSGNIRSLLTRAKMSAAMKGRKGQKGVKRSPETCAKLKAIHSNRSNEIRAKMAAAHRGRRLSAEHRAKLSTAHKGKVLTDSHRANIGRSHVGSKRSAETRKRMSAAQLGNKNGLGRVMSAETRMKISIAQMGNKNGIRSKTRGKSRRRSPNPRSPRQQSPAEQLRLDLPE